jgi:PAS domain S-box-containing protein
LETAPKPNRVGDLGWSKRLLAVSTVSILGLLLVCFAGGYTLYTQNKSTQETLHVSQSRANTAAKAQTAILIMGKAEVQLVNASDPQEQRRAAVLAIQASSTLDESIQRLDQALADNPKVQELSHSLQEITPMKIAIVRAVRVNNSHEAKTQLHNMQAAMQRIEQISDELSREEQDRLLSAVANQGNQASSTLRVLAILAGCCILLSLASARKLNLRTSQLDQARRESEIFINCVPSILIGTDNLGRITRWNSSASAIFDLSREEVQGKAIGDCGIHWLNVDFKNEIASWEKLDQSQRLQDFTFEKETETRVLGLTVNPIRFGQDRAAEFLITGADITERISMERELRQAQKLEAIGQLSAGIAHEINTPVQYARDNVTFVQESWKSIDELLSMARLMSMETVNGARSSSAVEFDSFCAEVDPDYLQKDIPAALAQSLEGLERVANIVRAMKEFSHPGSTEKAPLDINRAIASTIIVARSEWKYVAEVTTDFDLSLPPVPCYAGEFNQVILNLLINASHAIGDMLKESPQGKGSITFKTRRDGPWAEVQLRDSGKGIPDEISNKVFEPFFTTKEVGKGTGQGLALAHSVIVKKHAGKIWFESAPGRGTTFFVRLPLTEPAKASPAAAN